MTDAVMHVLCLKDTGHVIAAMTGAIAPTAEGAVGDGIPIASTRSNGSNTLNQPAMTSTIPADLIEVKTAPLDERVLARPLDYAINGGAPVFLPEKDATDKELALSNNSVTIKNELPETLGLTVVSSPSERRIQKGTSDPDTDQKFVMPLTILPDDTPASVPSGQYGVMVALAGERIFWQQEDATP